MCGNLQSSRIALCERYGVSNAHRTLHGALLDAELLAEVYLAMTRGQDSLSIDLQNSEATTGLSDVDQAIELIVVSASLEECAEHDRVLAGIEREIRRPPVWQASQAPSAHSDVVAPGASV